MSNNSRSRNYLVLLYLDNESHRNALDLIIKKYEYAYIVHDKDYDEETGELKKPHIHCVIRFDNARTLKGLSDELGIEIRFIEVSNSLDNSLLYLIHYRNSEKHSYSIDEVNGSLKTKLIRLINKDKVIDEPDAINKIIEYINSQGNIKYFNLLIWASNNGVYAHLRRSGNLMIKVVQEHNEDLKKYKSESYIREIESEGINYESNMD